MSVLFGDLLSQSYNITFSMFLYLVVLGLGYDCFLAQTSSSGTMTLRTTGKQNTLTVVWVGVLILEVDYKLFIMQDVKEYQRIDTNSIYSLFVLLCFIM